MSVAHPRPARIKRSWIEKFGFDPVWIREAARDGDIVLVDELPDEQEMVSA